MESIKTFDDIQDTYQENEELEEALEKIKKTIDSNNKLVLEFVKEEFKKLYINKFVKINGSTAYKIISVEKCCHNTRSDIYWACLTGNIWEITEYKMDTKSNLCDVDYKEDVYEEIAFKITNNEIEICHKEIMSDEDIKEFMEKYKEHSNRVDKNGNPVRAFQKVRFMTNGKEDEGIVFEYKSNTEMFEILRASDHTWICLPSLEFENI